MTALAPALSSALLRFIWQGALVGIVLYAILALLRKRSANARYLTACAGLVILAALPVVTTVSLFSAQRPATQASLAAAPDSLIAVPTSAAPIAPANWPLRVWAAGVLLFAIRLALSYGHVWRLRRTGEGAEPGIVLRATALAARMNIARPVVVLVSRIADCPSVTGWLRPAILLPAAVLAGIDADQLEAILAHELAHIRRHDYLVNLLQTVVETLLFYHPAVWWLSSRIRREREFCCDDLAVRYCGGAIGYARALTSLERLRTAPALTPAVNGGSLLFRIRRLVGEGTDTAPSKFPALAALLVAAICLAGSVHWAHGQPQNSVQVLTRAPLQYPESARAKGIEGTVTAEVTLDGKGSVVDARILSGPTELRRSALASILDWRFANAVAGEVRQVPIKFKKNMPSDMPDISAPGILIQADELNDRLMHLAEERTKLQQNTAVAQLQPELDHLAELRAEITALQSQLEQERNQLQRRGRQIQESPQPQSAEIAAQLNGLRENLARMQRDLNPNHPAIKEIWAQIQRLEVVANLENLEMQARVAQEEAAIANAGDMIVLVGRRLAHVSVTPINREQSAAGVATLPIQIGDAWTGDSQTKLDAWAQSFNLKPTYKFSVDSSGGISLVIILP